MEKYTQIQELDIAYTEINPSKEKTILFIHGNSSSKKVFQNQLDSKIFENYRMIAIDLPGHGNSSKAKDQDAYSISWYSEIVTYFIAMLGLSDIILVGHSLGGHITIGASRHSSVNGLMIFLTPPLEYTTDASKGYNPLDTFSCYVSPSVSETMLNKLIEQTIYNKEVDTNEVKEDYLNTDPNCRVNLGKSVALNTHLAEVTIIKEASIPIAILDTENDVIVNRDYIKSLDLPLWNGDLVKIKGSGHYPQLENADDFNKFLLRFLNEVF